MAYLNVIKLSLYRDMLLRKCGIMIMIDYFQAYFKGRYPVIAFSYEEK